MGISYKLVDIMGPDWLATVREANCDAFLVWPAGNRRVMKELYDERLKIMVDELGLLIFPTYDELWMFESKRRMYEWAMAHDLPMAATHILQPRRGWSLPRRSNCPLSRKPISAIVCAE